MPEGSIIMWSGYMSQLPDGWELCDGTTSCPQNLVDYFVLGKPSGETLGESSGAHTYSIATSSDYSHKHVSSHTHGGFTSTSHGHDNVTIPNKNGTTYTSGDNVPSQTSAVGVSGYTETWEKCETFIFNWSCWWESRWHDYPSYVGYSGPSTENGHHNHPVTINHGHTGSVSDNSHTHTLANKSHEHANAMHEHTVDNEPVYYQLAFIYLKGEG